MENDHELTVEIVVSDPSVELEQIEDWTRQLKTDLYEVGVNHVELKQDGKILPGTKSIDPTIVGTISAILLATVLPKLLDFLNEWVISRQSRSVKIKIQSKKGSCIEVEVPASMSKEAAVDWIKAIKKQIPD